MCSLPEARKGRTFQATVNGTNLQATTGIHVTGKGVTASMAQAVLPQGYVAAQLAVVRDPALSKLVWCSDYFSPKSTSIRISVTIAPDAELGERDLRVVGPSGLSNRYRFFVGDLPEINEVEPNSEKSQAQRIESLPILINGQIMEANRDFFRFSAKAGQTIVCDVFARRILPYIADASPGWFDACLTLYDADGKRLQYVDDFRFRPDPLLIFHVDKDGDYILEIRDVVYRGRADFVYRLSIGALPYITDIYPLGCQRGSTAEIELHGVNLPAKKITRAVSADSPPLLQVGVTDAGSASNTLPFAVGDLKEVNEVEPNDSLEQAQKVEVPVVINGRIDKPGDVDYYAFNVEKGQELVMEVHARRLESPLDSVLTLFNAKGQELAENDDTVDLDFPLVTHHADSRLRFTFPAAGTYFLRLKDIQGHGGEAYAYRLTIAPPRPDFALRVTPDNMRSRSRGHNHGDSQCPAERRLQRGDCADSARSARGILRQSCRHSAQPERGVPDNHRPRGCTAGRPGADDCGDSQNG